MRLPINEGKSGVRRPDEVQFLGFSFRCARGEDGEHIPSFFADEAEMLALAEAVRRKGARLLSINPATKRDGLNDADRALLAELADVSGAVVSWNDFGMGTPNGDSVLEYMEAELANGREIYAVARCQRAETRFTLKKLSAVFANSEIWVDLSRLDSEEKLTALADPEWRAKLAVFWPRSWSTRRSRSRLHQRPKPWRAGCWSTSPKSAGVRRLM